MTWKSVLIWAMPEMACAAHWDSSETDAINGQIKMPKETIVIHTVAASYYAIRVQNIVSICMLTKLVYQSVLN